MEKQKKVVDASVVFKLFDKNEEYADKSEILLEKHINEEIELVVPDILFVEVINALRFKKANEENLVEANKSLWDLNFNIQRINSDILEKSIINSLKYDVTIYDAIYISVAQLHGCELVTADKALYKIPNVLPVEKI